MEISGQRWGGVSFLTNGGSGEGNEGCGRGRSTSSGNSSPSGQATGGSEPTTSTSGHAAPGCPEADEPRKAPTGGGEVLPQNPVSAGPLWAVLQLGLRVLRTPQGSAPGARWAPDNSGEGRALATLCARTVPPGGFALKPPPPLQSSHHSPHLTDEETEDQGSKRRARVTQLTRAEPGPGRAPG